jgi:predicted PurR-regulated permease PerM
MSTIANRPWLVIWLLAAGWLLYLLSPILTPFIVAALLAYLGDPLVDRLEERRLPRSAAVSVVFLVIVGLLVLLLLILIPRIEEQISTLVAKLPQYIDWLKLHLLPHIEGLLPADAKHWDAEALRNSLTQHWSKAGGLLTGVWSSISASGVALVGWIGNLVLIPVLTFYLLRDWDRLVAGIEALLPRSSSPVWCRLASESDEVLGAFLRGQMLVMFALGVIYTTGLWLVGLDFALLIGMFAGIVSFVPYLGLIVGILIAGIASVLQFKGIDMLPWVIAVFVIGQLLEGFVLTPRLVGERIGLHPVAVIFAVMAGGQLYGFFGILVALPVAAVVLVLLRYALGNYRASGLYLGDAEE